MIRAADYVCKACGGDRICAELEARGTTSGIVALGGNHKPYFDSDGYHDLDDVEEISYRCKSCGAEEASIARLVIEKRADGQLLYPCGRCDHDARDHPQGADVRRLEFVRPPMPCTIVGCDCHDYYDIAIAMSPSPRPDQLEITA